MEPLESISPCQDLSDEEVQAAAAFVDADSFIQDIPLIYDSLFPSVVQSFSTGRASFLPLLEQSPSLKSDLLDRAALFKLWNRKSSSSFSA